MTDAETEQVLAALASSRRYRGVDGALIRRLAVEELAHSRTPAAAVKSVKRRLHQAIGAYGSAAGGARGVMDDLNRLRAAAADSSGAGMRAVCREVLGRHASTRERLPHVEGFYPRIWELIGGAPDRLIDLGCGVAPLSLPWMNLGSHVLYRAVDVDAAQLALVDGFLSLVGQPHLVEARDLIAAGAPQKRVDAALLLKLIPILDRQDPGAALRLLSNLRARHAIVSFPILSLGGRGKGMERTYRRRFETLVSELGARIGGLAEASVPNELVFVLTLVPPHKPTRG